MKKVFLIVMLFNICVSKAQQEVKIDIFDALALKSVEVSYENYFTKQSSFGASLLFNFEKNTADFRYNEKRVITPFLRHYFTVEKLWNFFGEVFFSLNYGEYKQINEANENTYKDYTDGALGVACGIKYISDGGFTVDIYGGAGRNLFSSESYIIVPRVGVNLGYQF